MPKLPKRLPYEAVLIAALLLGSCTADGQRSHAFTNDDYDRLDEAHTHAFAATEQLDRMNERLKAVEERLNMTDQSEDQ